MNSQVMVDRELLERCCKRMYDMMQGDLHKQLIALLATPAPIPDAGEGVRELITQTIGFEFLPNELQTVNADDLLRLVSALQASAMVVPDGLLSAVKRLLSAETRKCRELARAEYRIEADTDYRQAMVDLRAMVAASPAPGDK